MVFPLRTRPTESYKERPRAFGSPRDGGKRLHAGCDLYAPPGTEVLAVADGIVRRGPYLFYDCVYAIEVEHPGVGIVRYGEIQGSPVSGQRLMGPIKAGQVIGHVGKMKTISQSMLHFELYSGSGSGPLTVQQGLFCRRSDLIDPTKFLDDCEVLGG